MTARPKAYTEAQLEALERNAERYLHLRDEASRQHGHHKRRALTAGIVDWAKNLDPAATCNFWSSVDLTGAELDAAVDAHMVACKASRPQPSPVSRIDRDHYPGWITAHPELFAKSVREFLTEHPSDQWDCRISLVGYRIRLTAIAKTAGGAS